MPPGLRCLHQQFFFYLRAVVLPPTSFFRQCVVILRNVICLPGDPTVFGNLCPAEEIIEAVVESVRSMKFNGYAPSTGKLMLGAPVVHLNLYLKIVC